MEDKQETHIEEIEKILLCPSEDENKINNELSDHDKEIINKINVMNIVCVEDDILNSKFIKYDPACTIEYAREINKVIKNPVSEFKTASNIIDPSVFDLYMKLINPIHIHRQLLNYEFNNIVYSPAEKKDKKSSINQISYLLQRYRIPELDDLWCMGKKDKKKIEFNNTCIVANKYKIRKYIRRLLDIIEQLYPNNKCRYEIHEPKSYCMRCLITLKFYFKNEIHIDTT
jgi:hypothetical protein